MRVLGMVCIGHCGYNVDAKSIYVCFHLSRKSKKDLITRSSLSSECLSKPNTNMSMAGGPASVGIITIFESKVAKHVTNRDSGAHSIKS